MNTYNPLEIIKQRAASHGVTVDHGRIGQPLEYFEFDGHMANRVKYVAQKSGTAWFCYRVMPGKKGAVTTLANYPHKFKAANYALTACINNWKL